MPTVVMVLAMAARIEEPDTGSVIQYTAAMDRMGACIPTVLSIPECSAEVVGIIGGGGSPWWPLLCTCRIIVGSTEQLIGSSGRRTAGS